MISAEERISQLVRQHEKELLRLCCMYLEDRTLAEDAVQETFLKAYRKLHSFREESSVKTWLIRIAVNVCKDMRRSAWLRRNAGSIFMREQPDDEREERLERYSDLTEAIMRLPEREKEVVLLYYYEGMNQNETANVLHTSVATVCRRLEKAKKLLQKELRGGDGYEE